MRELTRNSLAIGIIVTLVVGVVFMYIATEKTKVTTPTEKTNNIMSVTLDGNFTIEELKKIVDIINK
jgi:hypothetical protein